jgi:hypothetical protein
MRADYLFGASASHECVGSWFGTVGIYPPTRDELDKFMALRGTLVARLTAGHRGFPQEREQKTLSKTRRYSEELRPPAPDVLPWEDYAEKFDPSLMRKAGHFTKVVLGHKVVVMPPAKGTPWKLQQIYANDVAASEKLADQDDEGLASGDDVVESKFDDIVSLREEKVPRLVVGRRMHACARLRPPFTHYC